MTDIDTADIAVADATRVLAEARPGTNEYTWRRCDRLRRVADLAEAAADDAERAYDTALEGSSDIREITAVAAEALAARKVATDLRRLADEAHSDPSLRNYPTPGAEL